MILTVAASLSTLLSCAPKASVESSSDPHLMKAMVPEEANLLQPMGEPITAVLTSAPNVPPPTGRTEPAKVIVNLEVVEVRRPIADGTEYVFWTYGGDVPGKFIRVRQGDTVEFHLQNHPNNKMPHNIDLHAVTGQGGGAGATATAPGHESVFTFKAVNAGLYVYHCATAPVPMHIANGMYGLIFVEPPEGLPPVDREYYVMQGDFYTGGGFKAGGLQSFDMQKSVDENPTYVLFNGRDGALTGDGSLTAKVGETVRLYFGVGGPDLTSSFHVIGEIFDRVYQEGGMRYQEQVQTTMVPAGGSAIMEFKVNTPATYILVDHSLTRAFNKGAIGMLKVDGAEDKGLNSGKQADNPYTPAGYVASASAADPMTHGKELYESSCAMCHQLDGKGVPGAFPPLAGSDWVSGDLTRLIGVPLKGLTGPITVSGQAFNGAMPPLTSLSDTDIAHVLTYVRGSFGNKGGAVTDAQVAAVRTATASAAPAPKPAAE